MKILENHSLAKYSTFKVGGPADFFSEPNNIQELQELVDFAKSKNLPITILGGGSNILISDAGLRGLVIILSGDFKNVGDKGNGHINCGAAVSYPKITKLALNQGCTPALGWAGTPGSVGGALIMNAGSIHGEIGEVVESVRILDLASNQIKTLTHSQIKFSYRNTEFPKNVIILDTRLNLNLNPKNREVLSLEHLKSKARDLVIRRKNTQPKGKTAGSIFKNPITPKDSPKLFAAKLIQDAGLKGYQIGGAQISELHANFFLNINKAKAQDIYELGKYTQKKVLEQFDIKLIFEVKLLGEF